MKEKDHGRDPIGSGSSLSGEADESSSSLRDYDPSRMQWQPIATAPKDGTRIIGCKLGWVSAWHFCFVTPHMAWRNERGYVEAHQQPTLWLPWPEPPPQGMEARSAETLGSAVGDSPVSRKADAPDPLLPIPQSQTESAA